MYAIEQRYVSYTRPEQSVTRMLKQRYKTIQGAEKAARNYRWICLPQGDKGPVTEESDARVIDLRQEKK